MFDSAAVVSQEAASYAAHVQDGWIVLVSLLVQLITAADGPSGNCSNSSHQVAASMTDREGRVVALHFCEGRPVQNHTATCCTSCAE